MLDISLGDFYEIASSNRVRCMRIGVPRGSYPKLHLRPKANARPRLSHRPLREWSMGANLQPKCGVVMWVSAPCKPWVPRWSLRRWNVGTGLRPKCHAIVWFETVAKSWLQSWSLRRWHLGTNLQLMKQSLSKPLRDRYWMIKLGNALHLYLGPLNPAIWRKLKLQAYGTQQNYDCIFTNNAII